MSDILYECGCCNASGVKLWRRPHGASMSRLQERLGRSITLLCRTCIEEHYADEVKEFARMASTDQVGGFLPAVPAGDTFWGYTSVPQDRVDWWNALPVEAPACAAGSERGE